jgi:glycosyltransferase involved in cell wall biosynthesis
MLRFSVIVPNLHSPKVHLTVKSLVQQQFDPARYEVIVVGMDKYNLIQAGERVSFDRSARPLSPAEARNRGAKQARGEILAFTDADCIVDTNWLAVLDERFADSQVEVLGGGVTFDEGNYWTFADNFSMFYNYMAELPRGTRKHLPSLNLAIRRDVFWACGGFDERYPRPSGEDTDLTLRLRRQGQILHFDPRAVVHHVPPRYHPADLWWHGFYQGKYSVKVDPRYAGTEGLPWPLRTRLGVLVSAPFLATAVTWRILRAWPAWRYWRTAPALLLSKVAWCVGAACHPL